MKNDFSGGGFSGGHKWGNFGGNQGLGEVALKTYPTQRTPSAKTCFEKAIAICRKIKLENEVALVYAACGRFHKQRGNSEKAREYLTMAVEIFEQLGTLIEPEKVKKELEDL